MDIYDTQFLPLFLPIRTGAGHVGSSALLQFGSLWNYLAGSGGKSINHSIMDTGGVLKGSLIYLVQAKADFSKEKNHFKPVSKYITIYCVLGRVCICDFVLYFK